jgi:hypothetical protein
MAGLVPAIHVFLKTKPQLRPGFALPMRMQNRERHDDLKRKFVVFVV